MATDSPDHVVEFYRKPLAKFGEVLECDHGKPVGSLTVTKSGLTCGNASDSGHELRAGTPDQFRIVGVNGAQNGKTKFGLVALVLPKNESRK